MSESEGKSGKSFWQTLPGIITSFAALLTAIGGCIAVIFGIPAISNKIFGNTPTPVMIQVITATQELSRPVVRSPTATAIQVTKEPTRVIQTDTPVVTSTSLLPFAYGFQTCVTSCDGQNSSKSFPGGITKIYALFNYENFSKGVKYVRTWSLNGMEWIRYSCNWDGPSSGTEVLALREPKGLHSGTWEITIFVDNEVVLKDQITVTGDWTYWDPAGTVNACHGLVD